MTMHNRRRKSLAMMILLMAAVVTDGCAFSRKLRNTDILYVKKMSEPRIPLTLDLSDAHQQDFLDAQMRAARTFRWIEGRDLKDHLRKLVAHHKKKSPLQKQTLLQMDNVFDSWQPFATITQLDRLPDGRYYTAALLSVPRMFHARLYLRLFDTRTWWPVGELATVETWYDNHVTISAEGRSSSREVTAIFTYLYNTSEASDAVVQTIFRNLGKIPDPTFSGIEPCRKDASGTCLSPGTPPVKICLNRMGSDCSYIFTTPEGQEDMIITARGAADFAADGSVNSMWEDAINNGAGVGHPKISMKIIDRNGGGACSMNLGSGPSSSFVKQSDELSWDFPNVSNASCAIAQTVDFHLEYSVPVNTVVRGTPTTKIVDVAIESVDTCLSVAGGPTYCSDYLQFVWGCLPAGTPIRMADRSLKPIEEIEVGEQVLADTEHRTLTVVDTLRGTEELPLVVVEDDRGNVLKLTETHPVMTTEGVKLAKQLKVGWGLTTYEGDSKIKAVRREESARPVEVYNLNLKADPETVSDDNTTLFAGNILVGDNRMQGIWEEKYRTNGAIEEVPEEWRRDYLRWAARQNR